MITRRFVPLVVGLLACALSARPAHASFHFMQVEQVIGGVNGDITAQAIQLRMRFVGQNLVQQSRIRAWDAAGANPVLIVDMTVSVPNGAAGARVLITSTPFQNYVSPVQTPNFAMTNLIPTSYLAAGSLTFEDDFGTIYWRVSWGGALYAGPGTVDLTNDPNGNSNPPIAGPLPHTSLQALRFTGIASATSNTSLADYALTPGASSWTNNAGASETVVGLTGCSVYAGIDLFTTPPGGTTSQDFGGTPIPPNFFNPGSQPFTGLVVFGGQPLNPSSPLGPTDTIVRRHASASLPTPGSSANVPIEIVALSLVSVQPITVTYSAGPPEQWNVAVCLSNSPQPFGSMTINAGPCACPEGGTFTSTLPVLPKLTFTRIGPPATRVLDFGAMAIPPIQFQTVNGRWLSSDPGGMGLVTVPAGQTINHDCDPGTPVRSLPPTTNFFAGVAAYRCLNGTCADPFVHRKRLTKEQAMLAEHGVLPAQVCMAGDPDGDGVCNDADNCPSQPNPLQQDQDGDGWGDVCDNCIATVNPCQEDTNADGIGDACVVAGVDPPPTPRLGIELGAPMPNPAKTLISYTISLPRASQVLVSVFDASGQRVRTLVHGELPAGRRDYTWDVRDARGARVTSGAYYIKMTTNGVERSRKVMVIQ